MASPAKSGPEQPSEGSRSQSTKTSSSAERKNDFDRTLEEVEGSRKDEEAMRRARMAPLEKMVDNKERRSDAKEAAKAKRIRELGDQFYRAAREKVDKELALERVVQAQSGEEEEGEIHFEDGDTSGIYSRGHGEDDESYSYHESEASSDGNNEEEYGEGASGQSPLAIDQENSDSMVDDLDWLHEVERRGKYDKKNLLAERRFANFPLHRL